MQQFERDYASLITGIMQSGEVRQTRNGETRSVFGLNLDIPMNGFDEFPLLQGRKMYYKGVFGELAAMLRRPKHIDDFTKWGCNYWGKWAQEDGSICIDYGNAWHANGQIEHLKNCLANNPTDRRMIISGWRPQMLPLLDLPCCHLLYQFYVRDGQYLDMIWYQRSVDMMIGLPSDLVFAAAWLIAIANEFGLMPGEIKMRLGDCHVYAEHNDQAREYVSRVLNEPVVRCHPVYSYKADLGSNFCTFNPADLAIHNYKSDEPMKLELKA